MDKYILLFESTSAVLHAEKILKQNHVTIQLVPIPRHLSSDCGTGIVFESESLPCVRSIQTEAHLEGKIIKLSPSEEF